MVESARAVWLSLQSDTDVLDGRGEYCVHYTCEGAGGVVLAVGKRLRLCFDVCYRLLLFGGVLGFEGSSGVVEASELD